MRAKWILEVSQKELTDKKCLKAIKIATVKNVADTVTGCLPSIVRGKLEKDIANIV